MTGTGSAVLDRPARCQMTSGQVCAWSGCTLRQLHHWAAVGHLGRPVAHGGPGSRAVWDADDAAVCGVLAQLPLPNGWAAWAGWMSDLVAQVRATPTGGTVEVQLGPTVTLTVQVLRPQCR